MKQTVTYSEGSPKIFKTHPLSICSLKIASLITKSYFLGKPVYHHNLENIMTGFRFIFQLVNMKVKEDDNKRIMFRCQIICKTNKFCFHETISTYNNPNFK